MAKLSKRISLLSATVATMLGFGPVISHFVNLDSQTAKNSNISRSFFATSTPSAYSNANKNYYAVEKFNVISNVNGPITLAEEGKVIQGYDWYGNINWKIDVSTLDKDSTKIVDWEFMSTRDWVYVITDNSYVLKINGSNGEILARRSFKKTSKNSTVSVPENPNKFGSIEFNNSLYIWNTSTQTPTAVRIDRNTLEPQSEKDNATIKFNESGRYLVKIFSLYPGYNLALHSNATPNSTLTELKLTFVDDNFKKIDSSNETTIQLTKNGASSSNINAENLAAYTFNRLLYKTGNSILVIGNKLYEVNLNKSQMGQSTITELKYQSTANNNSYPQVTQKTFKNTQTSSNELSLNTINSAFMDSQDNIYFKERNGSKIYSLDFNNNLTLFSDLATQNINNDIKNIVSTTNGSTTTSKENNLQIFGVPSAETVSLSQKDTNRNLRNTMFLANTDTSYITVINDSRIDTRNFKSESLTPKLILKNSKAAAFKDNIPSVIDTSYFETKAADTLDGSKVKFKADDLQGKLTVTATLTKTAWYSTDSDVKTSSIVTLNYSSTTNVKNKKIVDQVQWATENTFKSWFGKYTPQQLVESDLEKQTDLIKIKNSSNANNFKNLTKKIAIKNRNSSTGKITISGVISYTNRHNNYVNFSIPDREYTISKNTGKHAFRFIGETADNTGVTNGNEFSEEQLTSTIPIDTIKDERVNELKIFVPSMINPKDLDLFIEKEESYLPSRRTITKIPNDEKGTLTLMVMYNGLDPTKPYKFIKTFTGFQSNTTASVNFKGELEHNEVIADQFKNDTYKNPKNITVLNSPQKDYSKETAKDVQASELFNIYDTSLTKMGFIPTISINPLTSKDHEYGSIVVCLDYSPIANGSEEENEKKLKFPYKDKFGLKDYKIYQRYTGLLPIGETYKIELKQSEKAELMSTYNVDASIPTEDLLKTLKIEGYKPSEVSITGANWEGVVLKYSVAAQSVEYESVSTRKTFAIDWSEKFEKIRVRNLILAVTVTLLGVASVSAGVGVYAVRRHSIRKKMK